MSKLAALWNSFGPPFDAEPNELQLVTYFRIYRHYHCPEYKLIVCMKRILAASLDFAYARFKHCVSVY